MEKADLHRGEEDEENQMRCGPPYEAKAFTRNDGDFQNDPSAKDGQQNAGKKAESSL